MTYLLDTCVISELVAKQPNQQVLDWLDAQVPETLYLSVITIGEIAKGISKITASKHKESLTTWLNETLPNRFQQRILNIDVPTMLLWGNLVGQLEQNGRPLPLMDSLIAALAKPAEGIAIHNSLSLVTRNEKDFAGTGVVIVNPWSV
jgi:toxin FitB